MKCKTCSNDFPLDLFHKDKYAKNGYKKTCKHCSVLKTKQWKATKTKEELAQNNRKYKLKLSYGLSVEQYNTILEEQNYCCAICNTKEDELTRGLVVDHCHESNKVRGLLCTYCNVAIGMLKENEENLLASIQYLRKYK